MELIAHLGTDREAEILDLASAGKINDIEVLAAALTDGVPADTMDESELIEALPLPLTRAQRAALIRSSFVNDLKKADPEG